MIYPFRSGLRFSVKTEDGADVPLLKPAIDAAGRRRLLFDLAPKQIPPLERLLVVYEAEESLDFVLDTRRRIAALVDDPNHRARIYFALGEYCLDKGREDEAYADE